MCICVYVYEKWVKIHVDQSHSLVNEKRIFKWQEKQQKLAEDQRNLIQQQAQTKAQMARYEDELARKRMQVVAVTVILYACDMMMIIYMDYFLY